MRITPKHIAVAYSIVDTAGPSDASVAVVDDRGRSYGARDVVLAYTADIAVRILVTEPYIRGGSVIGLAGDGWRIDFLRNSDPDNEVDFFEGGRVAPESGIAQGPYKVTVQGPPGADIVEIAIAGATKFNLYALIDDDSGEARSITAEEFASLRAANVADLAR